MQCKREKREEKKKKKKNEGCDEDEYNTLPALPHFGVFDRGNGGFFGRNGGGGILNTKFSNPTNS